jgi:glycosyltransferase involved in cell wall biosynthesis
MENQPYISIFSPVFKAKSIVDKLVSELVSLLNTLMIDYKIILVDDSCLYNSWKKNQKECDKNENIKGVKLSENFGQYYAVFAGLAVAKGEWIIVMDFDLQDSPSEIPNLLKQAENGFEIVLARRHNRKDGFLKDLYMIFYFVFSYLIGQTIDSKIANFGIYCQKVISELNNLGEKNRFFPTMIQ